MFFSLPLRLTCKLQPLCGYVWMLFSLGIFLSRIVLHWTHGNTPLTWDQALFSFRSENYIPEGMGKWNEQPWQWQHKQLNKKSHRSTKQNKKSECAHYLVDFFAATVWLCCQTWSEWQRNGHLNLYDSCFINSKHCYFEFVLNLDSLAAAGSDINFTSQLHIFCHVPSCV